MRGSPRPPSPLTPLAAALLRLADSLRDRAAREAADLPGGIVPRAAPVAEVLQRVARRATTAGGGGEGAA